MSFLRKQQSRLVPAQAGIQGTWPPTFFLDCRLRGNDTPGPATRLVGRPLDGQGRGEQAGGARLSSPLEGRANRIPSRVDLTSRSLQGPLPSAKMLRSFYNFNTSGQGALHCFAKRRTWDIGLF
jgi:hypothetical protein